MNTALKLPLVAWENGIVIIGVFAVVVILIIVVVMNMMSKGKKKE
ncbi:hypothetical protein AB8P51_06480 [Muriicola sp. SD30]